MEWFLNAALLARKDFLKSETEIFLDEEYRYCAVHKCRLLFEEEDFGKNASSHTGRCHTFVFQRKNIITDTVQAIIDGRDDFLSTNHENDIGRGESDGWKLAP